MDKYPGLTQQEAEKMLKKFGVNEIKDPGGFSAFKVLLRQIKTNFIIYLLLIAAIISFLVGKQITTYTISAVVVMVVLVGFIQEYRAEKAISSLKKMIMPVSIVRRGGKDQEIESSLIVPEDIVILGTGERIPADCLILESKELKVDESILTGESKEVKKAAGNNPQEPLEENLIFMGTFIVSGRCIAQVIKTGMDTRFGKIARMISKAEKELPLQKKVNNISKYMVVVATVVSLLTGALMLIRAETINGEVITSVLILVIALAVSCFPEGFPMVLIATLANGAARMAKQNAIVNRMSIIETLGETTVICTDKTGTLTEGEMTIKQIYADDKLIDLTGSGFEGKGDFLISNKKIDPLNKNLPLFLLLKAAVLCNDAKIERTGDDLEYRIIGTPTEGALLVMAAKAEIFKEDLNDSRLEEMPFNSNRKMMSVLCEDNGEYFCFAKGAPEILLGKCTHFVKENKVVRLGKEEKDRILKVNQEMNSQAFRTLSLAYKIVKAGSTNYQEDELIFLGLVSMEDPPREEVKEAIELCFQAGIKVKMITGDNKETAASISKQIGLVGNILEGQDLDKIPDSDLPAVVNETVIFARVRPEHKLRIVKALKENGEIVTMTGDGVNDAPALKEAHIGVAMGKNGTDVSRSVADLTLKDNNFATIVLAIKEGRTIFNNIRKFVSYELSCNLSELSVLFLGVLLSPLFGWEAPLLLALNILFMNLVTDNLPSITLGFNPASKDILNEKPRQKAEILSKQLIMLIIFNGSLMAFFTLLSYYISFNFLGENTATARTTALVTLILIQIASAFNFRSFRHQVVNRSLFVNRYLVYASLLSIFFTLIIVYTGAKNIFETVSLGINSWVIALIFALLIILIYDLLKEISKQKRILLAEIT